MPGAQLFSLSTYPHTANNVLPRFATQIQRLRKNVAALEAPTRFFRIPSSSHEDRVPTSANLRVIHELEATAGQSSDRSPGDVS